MTFKSTNANNNNNQNAKQDANDNAKSIKKKQSDLKKLNHNLNYHAFKLVESKLYDIFDRHEEPAWLNLLLIENSKDYHLNKINTHAVMIAKTFEKWCLKAATQAPNSNESNKIINKSRINLDLDLQLSAFKVATRHHIILLESIVHAYDLDKINDYLFKNVLIEINKLDYKDKALCITYLMMHDYFDIKEVILN